MPDLSKAEVERRLEAIRINAGTVLTLDQTAQTDALQTALSLYARAEAAEQERDVAWAAYKQALNDNGELKDLEYKMHQERDAFRAEALGMRTLVDLATPIDQPPVDLAPLTAAAAERWEAMEAATDMLRRIATGQVTPEAGRHGAVVLFRANPYFAALAALDKAGQP